VGYMGYGDLKRPFKGLPRDCANFHNGDYFLRELLLGALFLLSSDDSELELELWSGFLLNILIRIFETKKIKSYVFIVFFSDSESDRFATRLLKNGLDLDDLFE